MSKKFGDIAQICFVVRDIEKYMLQWSKLCGIGPWFCAKEVELLDFHYKGKLQKPGAIVNGAFAYSGNMQFEMIEPLTDTPSIYNDFLNEGRIGHQHTGFLTEDYDEQVAQAVKEGRTIVQTLDVPTQGRCTYFAGESQGTIAELIDYTPVRKEFFGQLREIAAKWDGVTDPIRIFDPETGKPV